MQDSVEGQSKTVTVTVASGDPWGLRSWDDPAEGSLCLPILKEGPTDNLQRVLLPRCSQQLSQGPRGSQAQTTRMTCNSQRNEVKNSFLLLRICTHQAPNWTPYNPCLLLMSDP